MIKVGITGGIGSGKTTVCEVFKILGIPVFHADLVAKELQNNNLDIRNGLINLFGKEIYTEEGKLDRAKLANLIFNDKNLLEKVNAIIHPKVRQSFVNWTNANSKSHYALYEAAILFESGYYKDCDLNILVLGNKETRIRRVAKRDGLDENDIENRIKNQMADDKKIPLANFLIRNDDNKLIIPQVLEFDKLINQHGKIW